MATKKNDSEMVSITFRVDVQTKTALDFLEKHTDAVGLPDRGKRSVVLRRLIIDAASKLKAAR